MQRKRLVCLFSLVILLLVFSSCHRRHVLDIKPAMTKAEVISLWGKTDLISYKTTGGTTFETWEYRFSGSGSICRVTFNQDRVTDTPKCDRIPRRTWDYAQIDRRPYPERYYDSYPYSYYYTYPYPYYYLSPYYYDGPYYDYRPYPYSYYYPYRYHHHRH
ncbi:MAG: hypothetical protein FJ107_06375 [Deltaproteobacteria bacterium]|nr:hypothetical protein [Deltaproteobacteria bacterium]